MPVEYLLDSGTFIELARHPYGPASEKMRAVQGNTIFTSVIVASLVKFKILKSNATRLQKQMDELLEYIEIRPLPVKATNDYGLLKFQILTIKANIDDDDMWIAAHAMAEDAVLVTNNAREFSRIANLKVENWMQTA